jgi:hypothetical protein
MVHARVSEGMQTLTTGVRSTCQMFRDGFQSIQSREPRPRIRVYQMPSLYLRYPISLTVKTGEVRERYSNI